MQFATICSGSSGNCLYVEGGGSAVLVDAGCTNRNLVAALSAFGKKPEDLSAILITHEHSDHVDGAMRFHRRFGVPVWASERTWENLPFRDEYPEWEDHIFYYGLNFGQLELDFFRLSHDAVQPVSFVFRAEGKRLALITDTGLITPSMARLTEDCDAIICEANHDRDMLIHGPYPYRTKERILSDRGHLSNRQAGLALQRLAGVHTRHIVLAHLSTTNNRPDLALAGVRPLLAESAAKDARLTVAPRSTPHELIRL